MSAWMFFALLSPMLWAVVNLFDKLLRDKHLGTFSLSVFIGLSSFWVLAIIPFIGFSAVFASPAIVAVSFIAGALFFANSFPYFEALSVEEASRVVPLWALQAPMTLILALVFLKEHLLISHYTGFALVVSGAFLVSARKLKEVLKPSRAFFLMLIASSMSAAGIVISKWLYSETSFLPAYVLISIGGGIAALLTLLVLGKRRSAFVSEASRLKGKLALRLGFRTIAVIAASLTFNLAVLTGSVSLSSALGQLSAFYVFVAAAVLSRFMPGIIKEAVGRKTLLTKAAAILMIIAGVFAINL